MKIIITILTLLTIMSCSNQVDNINQVNTIRDNNAPTVEKIMGVVDRGGLYKIKLNDSTTILLYREMESCTMIQLK